MPIFRNFKKAIYGMKVIIMSLFVRLSLGHMNKRTVFIVAIHGSLHLLQICLHYIPTDIQVIVIANNLTNMERTWISQNLRVSKTVNIPRALTHGAILDILIFAIKDSFCTIDYDCFVLDDSLWENMFTIDEKTQCNVYFSEFNPDLNMDIPHTCLLMVNTEIYRRLIRKYKTGCNQVKGYDLLSTRVKQKLKEVGVDKNNLPEKQKVILDTLKTLQMLGVAENYAIDYRTHLQNTWKDGQKIFHVGGTSYWHFSQSVETLQGGYFWYRALELQPDLNLRIYYENEFPVIKTEPFLRKKSKSTEGLQEGFISFCDQIIAKGYSSGR